MPPTKRLPTMTFVEESALSPIKVALLGSVDVGRINTRPGAEGYLFFLTAGTPPVWTSKRGASEDDLRAAIMLRTVAWLDATKLIWRPK